MTPLDRLARFAIASHNRKVLARDLYDHFENALLLKMKTLKRKEIDQDGYHIKRVAIPIVACQSCGTPKDAPPNLTNHQPERLQIRKLKT